MRIPEVNRGWLSLLILLPVTSMTLVIAGIVRGDAWGSMGLVFFVTSMITLMAFLFSPRITASAAKRTTIEKIEAAQVGSTSRPREKTAA